MAVKIYNTLTKKKEPLKPIKSGHISFYHCGPTVYWTQHIGNMRAVVMADVVRRSLEYLGLKVNLVRNYTDVGHLTSDRDEGEDKLDKGAKREGATPKEIADKYIKIFEHDAHALNIEEPFEKPRATKYIGEMIDMIGTLIEKNFAYTTSSAIYFDTSKAKDYTRLSGQKLEDLRIGAGTGGISDTEKRNPQDFALWFFKTGAHANALQTWEAPFGAGFPGWHIECSVMAKTLLGVTIDIHMGGIEHIPVHHTNEIAQSESANGAPIANIWMHNEHLTVDGKKMSKSGGSSYTLDDIIEKGFDPLSLRYFFLQAHYRSKQNFTWDALTAAANGLSRIKNRVAELGDSVSKWSSCVGSRTSNTRLMKSDFTTALEDDFNIPEALAVLEDALKVGDRNAAVDFDRVLGLKLNEGPKEEKVPRLVTELAEKRKEARKVKNWSKADRLRGKINEQGYDVRDTSGGYILKRI